MQNKFQTGNARAFFFFFVFVLNEKNGEERKRGGEREEIKCHVFLIKRSLVDWLGRRQVDHSVSFVVCSARQTGRA
jgi:hypothetical protein